MSLSPRAFLAEGQRPSRHLGLARLLLSRLRRPDSRAAGAAILALTFAAACAGCSRDGSTSSLVKDLESRSVDTREKAARTLGAGGAGEAGVRALIGALKDTEPTVREAAAESLGKLKAQAAVAPLAAFVDERPERANLVGPKQMAIRAMAAIGGDEATSVLERLAGDRGRLIEFRGQAYEELFDKDVMRFGKLLLAAYRNREEKEQLRSYCAVKLIQAGELTTLDLVKAAFRGSDPTEAKLAWRILRASGPAGREAAASLFTEGNLNPVRRAKALEILEQGEVDMRMRTALATGYALGQGAVKAEAIRGLGRIGDATVLDLVVASADDPDPLVRKSALDAIEAQANPPDTARTRELAKGWEKKVSGSAADLDPTRRADAARGLGLVGSENAAQALQAALGDPDSRVRASAAAALGRLGNRDAAAALGRTLGDPDPAVGREVGIALARLGEPTLLDPYVGSPDAHIAAAARKAREMADLALRVSQASRTSQEITLPPPEETDPDDSASPELVVQNLTRWPLRVIYLGPDLGERRIEKGATEKIVLRAGRYELAVEHLAGPSTTMAGAAWLDRVRYALTLAGG